ncbi:hypothetical protein [Halarcobacter ebronensis]|uniref:Uncharacterized protein n=1 Tax=Halarcobacter ebronensis TaxID=1462615 RepID=A0A4Q1AJ66_9BACT|nr:hypothetical protein [Halarcobacter ebronensis]QKF82057.1 hypothetical protein AEBR_1574 [Halarcobacter ebronensis]RXK04110.1 hypothetical protein CRV07_11835 [Halarcobacter ebronensis]
MTAEQREEIEPLLKENQVAVDTQTVEKGKDSEGFPIFEIKFINAPTNYKLVRLIEPYNVAVLEDLSPTA